MVQDFLRSGGTERQSLFLAGRFAAAGHPTTLITFRPGGALASEIPPSVRHRALQKRDLRLDWFAPGLGKLLAQEAPDLIFCMGRVANCYAGSIQHRFRGTPVVATLRTGKALPWLFRRSLGQVAHIVANSQFARRAHCRAPALDRKTSLIRNALLHVKPTAGEAPRRSEDPVILLNNAMFRAEKNQRELIRLCAQLPRQLNWKLWLVGSGPQLQPCQRLARRLGLTERVAFWGYRPDPSEFYQRASIAVLTSRRESLPNFVVEAQTYGLPVVAFEVGGVDECFLPGRSGFLIGRRDQAGFLRAVEALIADGALRQRFSAEAAAFAASAFDPDRQAEAYLELAAKLTSGERGAESAARKI